MFMYTNWLNLLLLFIFRSEAHKYQSSIDKEVERVTSDLLDQIVSKDEISATITTTGNALSLLQNFVISQTSSNVQTDLNNNCDDENSNQSMKNLSGEKSSSYQTKSNENPLISLEKMLAYSAITTGSPKTLIKDNEPKKKKFDKYRLFAEKMIRSTLS